MTNKITNEYIKQIFGKDLPKENINNIKKAMEKYGTNYWWESKDPVEIAKYQIFEEILITNFSTFHEGIEKLIGRSVYTHEFGLNVEGIRQEVREAIARIDGKSGNLDDKVRTEREFNGIKTLLDYSQKTGKSVIFVGVDKK